MSHTDRAFIKAFADRRGHRAAPRPGADLPGSEEALHPLVSQFFTAATVRAVGSDRAGPMGVTTADAPRISRPNSGGGSPRKAASKRAGPDAAVTPPMRRDGAHQDVRGLSMPAPPHFSLDDVKSRADGVDAWHSPGRPGPPADDPEVPVPDSPFRAEWEVDGFTYPPICEALYGKSSEGLSELLRAILTRAWRGQNVVAFTSFGHHEGTSTVAMCLARMATSFSARVALVDGNLEHPSLAEALGLNVPTSWPATSADVPLAEAAIGSMDDRMVVLPLAAAPGEDGKSSALRRAAAVVATLKRAFDLIVVDAGPIYQAAHVWFRASETPCIHTATVVRDLRRTANAQLEDVCLRLQQSGIQDVAIVDNFRAAVPSSGLSSRCTNTIGN